jgi:hypothetical protein
LCVFEFKEFNGNENQERQGHAERRKPKQNYKQRLAARSQR